MIQQFEGEESLGNLPGTLPPGCRKPSLAPVLFRWRLSPGAPAERAGGAGQLPPATPAAAAFNPTIKIATFNIQVFGTSKLKKTPVMQVLAEVVRRFDLVAIQEVRSIDDTILPQFSALINSTGVRYDFVIGPRLGRTNSKEQYAILFDTSRIEVDPRSVYTVPDPQDLLHREPLVARFRARGVPPNKPSPSAWSTSTPIRTRPPPNWTPWPTCSWASSRTAAARMT